MFKEGTRSILEDLFLFVVIVLLLALFVAVGRIFSSYKLNQALSLEIRNIDHPENDFKQKILSDQPVLGQMKYFASINGQFYYPVTCSSTKTIKSDNRIWFSDKNEAEMAGYQISGTCR